MKIKSRLQFEIKDIAADGTFEGILSPYGNVDQGRDVVEPGAYTKTLKEHGSTVPLLWFHKQDMPIGQLQLDDRTDGLWCKGALMMELPKAKEAYALLKARLVKGLSIGFESVKESVIGTVRHLKEIKLYEGSIVMFPMNERALVTSVKGVTEKKDFTEELAQIQTLAGLYQMFSALQCAVSDAVWSDMSRDEKIAGAETVLEQFTEAFSAFFPSYLSALGDAYGLGPSEQWSKLRLDVKIAEICSTDNAMRKKFLALIGEEAGAATSESKAAAREPEPDIDHSEAQALREIREMIPA